LRHFHRKDMEIVNRHILHQTEVLRITVIIPRRSALQRGFLGQIGRITYPPKEDR